MSLRNPLFGVLSTAIAMAAFCGIAPRAQAGITVYVAKTGSDGNSYTQAQSPSTPFVTIQHAIDQCHNGDNIEVAPGQYNEALTFGGRNTIFIHSQQGQSKPILKIPAAQSYAGVNIAGSNHITMSGFEIDGTFAGPDCNGIAITPKTAGTTVTLTNHIEIRYCIVHNCSGSGISTNGDANFRNGCDYITLTGNEIYGCLNKGKYNGSGISLHNDQDYDVDVNGNKTTSGPHSYIQNNIVHDNVNNNRDLNTQGNIDSAGKHTDGNGIIVDTTGANGPNVVIQNNIVYRNGGRGIHIFLSSNVTVLNNSLYGDRLDQYEAFVGGELEAVAANNVLFSNNVVQGNGICPAFTVGTGSGPNGTISFKNNTYTDCGTNAAGYIDWASTIYSDPAWGSIFVNISTGDFHLNTLATRSPLTATQSQSALNRGSNVSGQYSTSDIDFVTRNPSGGTPPGGAVDRGAYER